MFCLAHLGKVVTWIKEYGRTYVRDVKNMAKFFLSKLKYIDICAPEYSNPYMAGPGA